MRNVCGRTTWLTGRTDSTEFSKWRLGRSPGSFRNRAEVPADTQECIHTFFSDTCPPVLLANRLCVQLSLLTGADLGTSVVQTPWIWVPLECRAWGPLWGGVAPFQKLPLGGEKWVWGHSGRVFIENSFIPSVFCLMNDFSLQKGLFVVVNAAAQTSRDEGQAGTCSLSGLTDVLCVLASSGILR